MPISSPEVMGMIDIPQGFADHRGYRGYPQVNEQFSGSEFSKPDECERLCELAKEWINVVKSKFHKKPCIFWLLISFIDHLLTLGMFGLHHYQTFLVYIIH